MRLRVLPPVKLVPHQPIRRRIGANKFRPICLTKLEMRIAQEHCASRR